MNQGQTLRQSDLTASDRSRASLTADRTRVS